MSFLFDNELHQEFPCRIMKYTYKYHTYTLTHTHTHTHIYIYIYIYIHTYIYKGIYLMRYISWIYISYISWAHEGKEIIATDKKVYPCR